MLEATWELESTMMAQYLQLFNSGMNFEDEILLRGGGGGGGGGRVVTPKLHPSSFMTCLGYNKSKICVFGNLSVKCEKGYNQNY